MSHSPRGLVTDPTEEEIQLAQKLAAKAMDSFRSLVSEAAARAIRDAIADELLFTEAGRKKLSAARPDPLVEHSGAVAKVDSPPGDTGSAPKKAGSGS